MNALGALAIMCHTYLRFTYLLTFNRCPKLQQTRRRRHQVQVNGDLLPVVELYNALDGSLLVELC